MSVRFDDHTASVESAYDTKIQIGLRAMASDFLNKSLPITPSKTGELRNRRRIVAANTTRVDVKFDSKHAAVQNAGQRRGVRPFRNYTTAGTGKEFVQKGLKRLKPSEEYFK